MSLLLLYLVYTTCMDMHMGTVTGTHGHMDMAHMDMDIDMAHRAGRESGRVRKYISQSRFTKYRVLHETKRDKKSCRKADETR